MPSPAAEPVWAETDLQPLAIWNREGIASVMDGPQGSYLQWIKTKEPIVIKTLEAMHAAIEMTKRVPGIRLGSVPSEPDPTLSVSWPGPAQATDFHRAFSLDAGLVRTTARIGDAGMTRTFFASAEDHAIFIHLISDKPGTLSFRVITDAGPYSKIRIENRRQIIAKSPVDGGFESRVWVLPFESDVTPEATAITVRGEGEALLIWTFGPAKGAETNPDTLETLAARYDPGAKPPDWSKIWQGALATQMKSAGNPR